MNDSARSIPALCNSGMFSRWQVSQAIKDLSDEGFVTCTKGKKISTNNGFSGVASHYRALGKFDMDEGSPYVCKSDADKIIGATAFNECSAINHKFIIVDAKFLMNKNVNVIAKRMWLGMMTFKEYQWTKYTIPTGFNSVREISELLKGSISQSSCYKYIRVLAKEGYIVSLSGNFESLMHVAGTKVNDAGSMGELSKVPDFYIYDSTYMIINGLDLENSRSKNYACESVETGAHVKSAETTGQHHSADLIQSAETAKNGESCNKNLQTRSKDSNAYRIYSIPSSFAARAIEAVIGLVSTSCEVSSNIRNEYTETDESSKYQHECNKNLHECNKNLHENEEAGQRDVNFYYTSLSKKDRAVLANLLRELCDNKRVNIEFPCIKLRNEEFTTTEDMHYFSESCSGNFKSIHYTLRYRFCELSTYSTSDFERPIGTWRKKKKKKAVAFFFSDHLAERLAHPPSAKPDDAHPGTMNDDVLNRADTTNSETILDDAHPGTMNSDSTETTDEAIRPGTMNDDERNSGIIGELDVHEPRDIVQIASGSRITSFNDLPATITLPDVETLRKVPLNAKYERGYKFSLPGGETLRTPNCGLVGILKIVQDAIQSFSKSLAQPNGKVLDEVCTASREDALEIVRDAFGVIPSNLRNRTRAGGLQDAGLRILVLRYLSKTGTRINESDLEVPTNGNSMAFELVKQNESADFVTWFLKLRDSLLLVIYNYQNENELLAYNAFFGCNVPTTLCEIAEEYKFRHMIWLENPVSARLDGRVGGMCEYLVAIRRMIANCDNVGDAVTQYKTHAEWKNDILLNPVCRGVCDKLFEDDRMRDVFGLTTGENWLTKLYNTTEDELNNERARLLESVRIKLIEDLCFRLDITE